MTEYNTYNVEYIEGEKFVHYNGYVYRTEPNEDGEEWRAIEFAWAYAPVAPTLAAGKTMRDAVDAILEAAEHKQYIYDLDELEAESYRSDAVLLPLQNVTVDTPCGWYWCPI